MNEQTRPTLSLQGFQGMLMCEKDPYEVEKVISDCPRDFGIAQALKPTDILRILIIRDRARRNKTGVFFICRNLDTKGKNIEIKQSGECEITNEIIRSFNELKNKVLKDGGMHIANKT